MSGAKEGGKRLRGEVPRGDAAHPLVSIITVVYNGAATLEATIKSVIAQDYPNIEYIVVDGGSADGTLDLLRKYDAHIDHWKSEKDKGIYDAMNKGLERCTGEWIGLINADDQLEAGAISDALKALGDRRGVNIIHGDILIAYANGGRKRKKAKLSGFLLQYWEMVFNHPSFLVRRSYYQDHPFDIRFKVCADHHWTIRAYREDPEQFFYTGLAPATFAMGGASNMIPWRKALDERWRMSRALGMGWFESALSVFVRAAFFIPQYLRLKYNAMVAK
jgi:glycosyltransferase involved in cell wall biosynthesis